jgi:hypothetical protein
MLKGLTKKLAGTRNAVTGALDELDVIRAQVAEKRQEIEKIRRAPIPVSEALEQFDRWAADKAEDAVSALHPEYLTDPNHAKGEIRLPDLWIGSGKDALRNNDRGDEILLGLIFASAMPAVRSIVEERLEAAVAGRECLTAAERVECVTLAEGELLQLELSEEALVRSLETAGLPVERRADAAPAAVLAAEASLPS